MSGLSYRKDVQFLQECNPPLVERNAAEFRRLRDLLVQVGGPPGVRRPVRSGRATAATPTPAASPRPGSW